MSLFEGLANSVGLGAQGASNNMCGNAQNMSTAQYNQQAYNAAQQRRIQGGAFPLNSNDINPLRPFNPNEIEAFQIPLSQLVTLWQAKHGDKWVDGNSPHDDSFYSHACMRLNAADMFEKFHGWVRLKEGV